MKRLLVLIVLLTLSLVPMLTLTAPVQAQQGCPPSQWFTPGTQVRVAMYGQNNLRSYAGIYAPVIIQVSELSQLTVTSGGPYCVNGYNWYPVYVNATGQFGWMAEGDWLSSYLEPITLALGYDLSGTGCEIQPSTLVVGEYAQVSPGIPNNFRLYPTIEYGNLIGKIPGGAVVLVMSGPYCNLGYWWWEVNYQGTTGWTVDGPPNGSTSGEYWLVPIWAGNHPGNPSCYTQPLDLHIGQTARVSAGLPNRVRSRPALSGEVRGLMSQYEWFTITSGPICYDGYWWWQVDRGDLTGWTAQGNWQTNWIEPVVVIRG